MGAALGLASHGRLPEVSAQTPGPAPSGEIVFQSDREGPTRLFVIDVATRAQRRVGAAGSWMDEDPSWAADGESLFFTSERSGRGEIFRVWLNDKRVERVTSGFSRAIMPATSPDGRYLAFAAQFLFDFKIELLDLKTGERARR